jgi:hypothetical protein
LLGFITKKKDICYTSLKTKHKIILMKRFKLSLIGLLAITGVVILFHSCDKVNVPVNVPATSSAITFYIPHSQSTDTTVNIAYSINIDSLIQANSSLNVSNITSIKVDSVNIAVTAGASINNNLNNINTASLTVESDASLASATPLQIAAFNGSSATNSGQDLTIFPASTNFVSYVATTNIPTNFTFQLHVNVPTPITNTLTCTATVHFIVQASL